jgi:hypothetical protein
MTSTGTGATNDALAGTTTGATTGTVCGGAAARHRFAHRRAAMTFNLEGVAA